MKTSAVASRPTRRAINTTSRPISGCGKTPEGLLDNLSLSLILEGRDAFYFSDSHDARSIAYDLFHASLTWDWRDFSLSLWGRNLADEDYFVRGFYFGNDPRDGYVGHRYTQLGEPRRFGLTVSRDF